MKENKIKREKFVPSIRSRIFVSMLVLVCVMLIILWITQTVFLTSMYRYIKTNDMEKVAEIVNSNIDNENFIPMLEEISSKHETCLTVLNISKNGETVYSSHALNDCVVHKMTSEDIIKHWYMETLKNDGSLVRIIPREDFYSNAYNSEAPNEDNLTDCIISANIVETKGGETYFYILNSSIEPVSATVRTLRVQLISISVIMVAVTGIISLIISKRIASPIVNMCKDVKKISKGIPVVFEETGTEETVELAKTLNNMSEELNKVDKMQKELIANISHDLRTPLTMISGYSEVMRDIPGENTPENMQVIIDEAARLSSLVNDLLDLSKFQTGVQVLNCRVMNLTKTVRSAIERYEHLISHKGYKITFEYDEDVCIFADEIRILQVIYNLVNNAINYTGEDKTVTIKQAVYDGLVKIQIIDTGCGISEDELPLIWDRYYKVDKVHSRARVGTGIGLSIVKNILTIHDCRFGVESEINKGSTFWFEFKIVEEKNKIF
ncbi:MAG: HAMP domain-containing histidine kinase [Clostridia bacterium]|nr:HAMP domain-containing histidine kinase [Clostridia bacterium]